MKQSLLRAGLGLALGCLVLAVAGAGACGGNVVVDPVMKGTGGHGGSSSTTLFASSASTSASSSVVSSVVATSTTTSFSSTAASSSSGNAMACSQCANMAAQGPCSSALDACSQQSECVAIQNCHDQCGFGPGCQQQCDAAHPTGQPLYQTLINCAVCQNCSTPCQGLPVEFQYCTIAAGP